LAGTQKNVRAALERTDEGGRPHMGMSENYILPGDSVSGQICSGAATL